MALCDLCPRRCRVDRSAGELGYCGMSNSITVAKTMLHKWEEPCISGNRGSGAVFFSGCSLGCIYCQNRDISYGRKGSAITESELLDKIDRLVSSGAHNINFVTPTHFTAQLVPVLEGAKKKYDIPIVWNSSGYESIATLNMLDGLVDVYLPDYKYCDSSLSTSLSSAADYPEIACMAIKKMTEQRGIPMLSEDGMLLSGVMVRHLVLPGYRQNSLSVLETLASEIGVDNILLSLMRQYTPDFYLKNNDPLDKNLCRRLTSFEYDKVADCALKLGFKGFFQDKESATSAFTPDFDNE